MKGIRLTALIIMTLMTLCLNAQELDIRHLSDTHSIIRISTDKKFLLLPVQESVSNAKVRVLIDTRFERSFNIRLAEEKIDYYVPFDLSAYKKHAILLDVIQDSGRESKRELTDDICWNSMKCSDSFDTGNREKYRPAYHFSPLYGWMNDPNGLVYKDGEYHLFYQYNPYGSLWGNMTWGHAVTKDFVRWTHLDPAIFGNELGDVFSGSAIVDKDNVSGFGAGAIIAMYTSAGINQTQSIAYSTDNGRTFNIYEKNPVITSDIVDFRDPKMFFDEQTNEWKVVIASGQEVRFYTSKNLKDWTYESSFGTGYGNHKGVWECPDLLRVKVAGSNEEKYVLILNINPGGPFGGSATQYFVGNFDGHKFTCESKPETTKWMDYGKDHYATVTWSNAPENRKIALAWMSNWQYANAVPTQQFRSANSIPRELSLIKDNGEYYLYSYPVKEMEMTRGKALVDKQIITSNQVKRQTIDQAGDTYEIILSSETPIKGQLSITLSNHTKEEVEMIYDTDRKSFTMDRTGSGDTGFSKDFPIPTTAPVHQTTNFELRLLVDRCSIEAFADQGSVAMSNLVFPSTPYNIIEISGNEKNKIRLTVYPLNIK